MDDAPPFSSGGPQDTDPELPAELAARISEAERQVQQAQTLLSGLPRAKTVQRPAPDRWSAAEHVAHMALTVNLYLDHLDSVIRDARERGPFADSSSRGPLIGRFFIWTMEPPARLRVRTFKPLIPVETDRDHAMDMFRTAQDRLVVALRGVAGVDLGRIRVRSPLVNSLRMSLGQAFDALLAHNRRHLWHVEQLLRPR